MPIKSFLAIPSEGKKDLLVQELSLLSQCEITQAENKNVLLVMTETQNEEEDTKLMNKMNNLDNLQLLTLVSAFSNDQESIQL